MLTSIQDFIKAHSGREAFFQLIEKIFVNGSTDFHLIKKAYNTVEEEFTEMIRDGGDEYLRHLEAVPLILIYRQRVRNANVIAASLLHDIIEDRAEWDRERIKYEFNAQVAYLVWIVTKLDANEPMFGGDKLMRNIHFQRQLMDADLDSIRIKLADVLHNDLTIWDSTEEKRFKKIMQTEYFYMMLAVKHNILVEELRLALAHMKEGNKDAKKQ